MSNHNVPRRTFLKLAALGGAGVALVDCSTGGAMIPASAGAAAKKGPISMCAATAAGMVGLRVDQVAPGHQPRAALGAHASRAHGSGVARCARPH